MGGGEGGRKSVSRSQVLELEGGEEDPSSPIHFTRQACTLEYFVLLDAVSDSTLSAKTQEGYSVN